MLMLMYCLYKREEGGKKQLLTDFSSTGKSLMEAWLMVTDWTCRDTMQPCSHRARASIGLDAWRHLFKQDELLISSLLPGNFSYVALQEEEEEKETSFPFQACISYSSSTWNSSTKEGRAIGWIASYKWSIATKAQQCYVYFLGYR